MNLGLYSYAAAMTAYGIFAIMLLFSWRASLQGKLLTIVAFVNTVWAGLAASIAVDVTAQIEIYKAFEVLRYIAWYVFLLKLFERAGARSEGYRKFVSTALPVSVGFGGLVLLDSMTGISGSTVLNLIGHIFLALGGLAIIEQLYRNTSLRHRWAIKYLILGAGGIFAFDFYLYADTLLFRGVDQELWEARGVINLIAVPLLVISSARNKNWSLNVFVSRDIVLNTTAILGGGIYLLAMAGAGYYLREYGGSWGRAGQIIFFTLSVVILAAVLFSGQLRARVKVFLGKHFYKNKYDYRIEWLRLTEKLSDKAIKGDARYQAAIEALANTVDARAGMLWLREERADMVNIASWNTGRINEKVPSSGPLLNFFEDKGFVINLDEIDSRPDEYEGLKLPDWVDSIQRPWLMIPLFASGALIGFALLANPLVSRSINWEDRDLLLTAARQVASYLMVLTTSDALAEAKQFEVFTRLSAYMVHDLKNIAAELELVARNAKKHIGNPAFINDAFETVDHAAVDIKKLLEQLRNKRVQKEKRVIIDLQQLVQKVISNRAQSPLPRLNIACSSCLIVAEKDRLANVLAHLLENAQQATAEDGVIEVTLRNEEAMQIIEIRDNGSGMDADFVRNRLFKPFDTTKGNAGMGIGMYESREFVRLLGGDISVESEPGKGTIVTLHIPSYTQGSEHVLANA